MKTVLTSAISCVLFWALPVHAEFPGWKHSGSMFILTTPEGANLPASASLVEFPLLVRLHKDFFPFSQTKAKGEDLRFSLSDGKPLKYQIEEWDPANGVASIWVRVPKIQGNSRQELKLYWGKVDADYESNGKDVFNESNGYLSVWHMNDSVNDEVGTLISKDTGTTATPGIVGQARHFPGQKGIYGGDKIQNYPVGASSHSTEAWFRAEKPNGNIVAWGNEQGQGKVVMQFRSPPHINMDCYFSNANVTGKTAIPMSQWTHVVHTYENGNSRIYVNGVLDTASMRASAPLAIKSPSRLWIGGWYNNYDFEGDIDDVRISKVVRSADWIKLQYQNQKPQQTLVGPLVQSGDELSVSAMNATVDEGKSLILTAKAGGAQKVYWIVKRDGKETVMATDRFTLSLDVGRVVGDQSFTVQFKAIYANEIKTKEIPVVIKESIPEPIFTLQAPLKWDGRQTIEVVPQITNLEMMQSKNVGKLNYIWTVSNIAVIKEVGQGKLILKRAQNSGPVQISVAIDNGGKPTVQSTMIQVKEPAKNLWVERVPTLDEKPVDGQFFARDHKNEGTISYRGKLSEKAESVFIKLYADDKFVTETKQKPADDKSYSIAVKIKPGLIKYKVEFGTRSGAVEKKLHSASDLVCGDAYLIDGQSNAEATDVGKDDPTYKSVWIRSFGSMAGDPTGARLNRWGQAVVRDRNGGKFQIGYWGMELAKRLMEGQKMPICMLNGAVGGSRIDVHQRNHDDPTDVKTIYGRLLWRVQQAKLTHGIRGVFWHQGENDQGADGPTGGFGYENYQQYFVDMTAGWKTDYPNIQHYYVFQIWPKACSMGTDGSDNRLREVQRTLPNLFSNLSIMPTLGIKPPGGCHFPIAGYAEFARLMGPLVERDFYGKTFSSSITSPNLKRVYFANDQQNEIVLEFDQPLKWDNVLTSQFYLDGQKGKVKAGSASGRQLKLELASTSTAKTITYLDSQSWSQDKLLFGENGIPALTFCEVPIQPKAVNTK